MLIPMLILALAGFLFARSMVVSFGHVADEALEELSSLIDAQSSLLRSTAAFHVYVNRGDPSSRERLARATRQADEAFQSILAAPLSEGERQPLGPIMRDWQDMQTITSVVEGRLPASVRAEHVRRYDDLTTEIQQSLDQIHRVARLEVTNELREAQADEVDLRRATSVIVAIAFGLSLLAATMLGRAVLGPVQSLRQAARLFGTGNLSYRVVVERRDELGQLAELFNTMAAKIERSQEDLTHQASHDGLTGLVNRVLFTDRLGHALARTTRQQKPLAVMIVDLDGFKQVNDSLGHSAGDDLLVEVGRRLRTAVRAADTAGRMGGDEFAVLVEDLNDPGDAVRFAERIIESMRRPFIIGDHHLAVRCSIGIAVTDEQQTTEELLRNADLAMYAAKRRGKGRFEVFDPSMHQVAVLRAGLEDDLRRGVENEEFLLHYQPVVDLATNRITGVEALVRWQHPTRGLVPPAEFIPLAEDTGLILPIGRWVLREACRQVRLWQVDRAEPLAVRISVNVSVKQLEDPGFIGDVAQALRDSGLAPEALILEVTETVLAQDIVATGGFLKGLKQLGVRIAVDDFGIGYSSLNYLRRLPVDIVKIDRTFVSGLERPEEIALTTAIISLSKALKLQTLAEGVEQAEQAGELRALGCDAAQGYFFAEPVDATQMSTVLSSVRPHGDRVQPVSKG